MPVERGLVAIGGKVVGFASASRRAYPNTFLGVNIGLFVAALISSTLVLDAVLARLAIMFCLKRGALEDISRKRLRGRTAVLERGVTNVAD